VTAICFNAFCSDSQRILVHALFAASGSVYEMPEDRFDIVTALSGSGPAFVYHFIDVMAQSAASQGLCPDDALAMASRTVKGAARMLLETGQSPEELITQVKSKGGTTEAGLKILQCSEFRRIVDDAIRAAAQRSKDLSLA
jgi:pyrroline-5-carboxylate reductase